MTMMRDLRWNILLSLLSFLACNAFTPMPYSKISRIQTLPLTLQPPVRDMSRNKLQPPRRSIILQMGLDIVTSLRTEWISVALCTNQTPRAADICLQLGVEDGRAVTFLPRTIRELITSSAEADGKLTISARRQLKQQQDRRGGGATVTYIDQPADDLRETPDESVDVVISLQAAQRMVDNGLDWKKSIREAARVLKPGGRLLFVEQTTIQGESYLEYIENLRDLSGENMADDTDEEDNRYPIFDDVGWDAVDLVLVPHTAGVAIKAEDASLTPQERARKAAEAASRAEKERIAEISLEAYERGLKRRKKKKKKKKGASDEDDA